MQNDDEHTDRTFAEEALSRLSPITPSATLLRRVTSIPIETRAERSRWGLFGHSKASFLVFGSLALGALIGAIPLETADVSSESSAEVLPTTQPAAEDLGEFEDALSWALGTAWSQADVMPGETL